MAQESIKGWGGAREGGGRKAAVPYGEGQATAVTARMGAGLLDAVRQRWPNLTSDGDVVRAAMMEAAGYAIYEAQGLTQVEALFTPEETGQARAVLALLADHRQAYNATGANPLGVQIELASKVVNESPELQERLKNAEYMDSFSRLVVAARSRRRAGGKAV